MNQEQILGQIRTFLAAALAAMAAKYVPPEMISWLPVGWEATIAGIVSAIPIAAWSWWAKRPAAVGAQAVKLLESDGNFGLAQKVADATQKPKV